MRKKISRIGVFGGSFNPVHQGHMKLAAYALSELNLDEVVFIPSYLTPLKKQEDLLPVELRVRLLKIAVRMHKSFSLSLCEIERKGLSYTVDTLKDLKRRLPKDAVIFFLTGADTLKTIERWKSLDKILKLCRFVVMSRPGHSLSPIPERVSVLPFDAVPISSSEIRNRLEEGRDVSDWVVPGTKNLLKKYWTDLKRRERHRNS